jgi:beta-galactosidase
MRVLTLSLLVGLASIAGLSSFARENTPLESSWRFKSGDVTGAERAGYSDLEWERVSVPHNWGWQEAQLGKTNYYRGPGWYRRELNIGSPETGKRYFVRFDAASSVADVYLNGKLLASHRGAFGAFCVELTSAMSPLGRNVLAVRVDNAPAPDLAPLSGDFSVYGGLYRPVHLIVADETCFALTDHGSPGVAWQQTSVSTKRAVLDVTAQISNGSRSNRSLTFVARVLDAAGRQIAVVEQPVTVVSNSVVPCSVRLVVPHPHLWNGRLDPYLYTAVAELKARNYVRDAVQQPLGLRFYSVDPNRGFFLNGRPYHLHGVDRHQDRWNKGWAVTEADLREDMDILKELGATVIRCAHYEHSDYFYGLCDKAGILVWAELPQVNEIAPTPEFAETSRNQLLDLIRQNVNHPSIFAWSLFNELRYGKPDPHRELQDLRVVAHGEDPTRPTIAATMTEELPQMNRIPDWLGWNRYAGWYSNRGTISDWGKVLDGLRATSRYGGFCVSEYGAGANIFQHEQNPRPPVTTGQWHPEEWQALVHEAAWHEMKARPFVWGTFVWCLFDFTSASRHEGDVPGRNDKGLVTGDRKIRKDAFYFYKANWSDQPVLYITSRRFVVRTNAVTDVKIYSNAPKVELFLNGKSQGTRRAVRDGIFIWKDVKLAPAENLVSAKADRKGAVLEDHCAWKLEGASEKL